MFPPEDVGFAGAVELAGVSVPDGDFVAGTSMAEGFLLALGPAGRGALVCPEGDLVVLVGFC